MEILRAEHLTKIYGKGNTSVTAVNDLSLSVAQGEFVAVVGSSGSGKSTLLHMLGGVDQPTEGKVWIQGEDIYTLSTEKLAIFRRRQIGLIYQFFNLIPTLNVEENITLPCELDGQTVDKKRLDKLIDELGLNGRKTHLPEELSGGQQQRVSIGRALINRPAIVLADEPTGNLDKKNSDEIVELLRRANQEYRQTIIMITHQMEVIKEIAERVAVIEHGRIIEEGSVVDLFTNPQTPTLKKFVGSVMSSEVPEQLSHMDIHADKENADDQTVLSLSFRGDVANEPIIANLIKKYNLDVSILYGSIDYIQNVSFGRLIITIIGDDSDMKEALNHLKSLPITSEVLGYVSSH